MSPRVCVPFDAGGIVAASGSKAPLEPFTFERRVAGEHDVVIDVKFCGVCHSDIHQVRNGWGGATFPMLPGHESVGIVSSVGPGTTRYAVGDRVGVGCCVDSCRKMRPVPCGARAVSHGHLSVTYDGTGHVGEKIASALART